MSSPLHRFGIGTEMLLCLIIILSLIGILVILLTNSASASQPVAGSAVRQHRPHAAYDALPLGFELNQGQTNQAVRFLARSEGYVLFLTPTEAVMALDNPSAHRKGKENREAGEGEGTSVFESSQTRARPPRSIVRMKLEGANPEPQVEGLEQLATTTSYFTGSDPANWRTDISTYARVRYAQVYPGIDMLYYGNQRQLEYDLSLHPDVSMSQQLALSLVR